MILFFSQPIVVFSCNHHFFNLKLEKKLKLEIEAWEGEQGREFLVNGQKFLQYVDEQWELYQIEKEREKQERVRPSSLCWRFILSTGKCLNISLFQPNSIWKRANRPRRICCMAPSYEPLPSADSWAPPHQINPERCQTCLCSRVWFWDVQIQPRLSFVLTSCLILISLMRHPAVTAPRPTAPWDVPLVGQSVVRLCLVYLSQRTRFVLLSG